MRPDLCVLGAGAGGTALAVRAAASGLAVVLVEKSGFGREKLAHRQAEHALVAAGRFLGDMRGASRFGFDIEGPGIDFTRLREANRAVASAIAPTCSKARLEAMNVRLVTATGRFSGRDCLEAGGAAIRARRFVVATGSEPKPFRVRGIELVRPLDDASLCALDHPPRHLIVIGADPHGLALAQAFRRLGSEVTILARSPLFAFEDEELMAPVRTRFARDGVVIREGVTIVAVEPRTDGVLVLVAPAGREETAAAETIEGSHLLLATGGRPLVEGLGLAAAGVGYDTTGIATDRAQRTTNRRIFAIGGCAQGPHSALAAEHQAGVALRAAFGLPWGLPRGLPWRRMRRETIARVISTDPVVAFSGLTEAEARERHRRIRVLRWPFAETDQALFTRAGAGHVKIIATAGGRMIGAGMVGPAAGELINLCTLAISYGMTAAEFATLMMPYPVLADAPHRAAAASCAASRGSFSSRHVLRFLRWLCQGGL